MRPDFFIVGAPKCGTTALYEYLRRHPGVFMPFHKEPLYFGSDLHPRYGRMREEDYLALFRDAKPGQRVGEASAWYLYSRTAAGEIKAFAPEAQIIVMLRDPVEMMYAQHSQLLFNVQEEIADFGEALDAEPQRKRGERLPAGPVRVENLFYRDAAHFAGQLERYYACFGRDQVHVIVHDDLRADTPGEYRRVLEFLGVDPDVTPDFETANPNKTVRSRLLQRIVYHPPGPLRRIIPWLRRFPLVHRLRGAVLAANSRQEPRRPLDPELRRRLSAEFAPEVSRLGELLGRDLSHWSAPAGTAGSTAA
jgi:hypothetical protein